MKVSSINNSPYFGMKWSSRKVSPNRTVSIINLDNGNTIAISTSYEVNNPVEKMYKLFNKVGDMVKVRFKTFFKNGKKSSVITIDNPKSIKEFLD